MACNIDARSGFARRLDLVKRMPLPRSTDQLTHAGVTCAAFAQLQSVCSKIMHVAREEATRDEYVACVHELREVLERLDGGDVQAHMQYVLLPLCVILDAKGATQSHDSSLCGTLACLRVLASRCSFDEHEGPPLVQRMLAMLGDADASYSAEARRIMAEILGAIFGTEAGVDNGDDGGQLCRPCQRSSYLSSEQWRPLVGNALSILLNHPFNDVTRPSSIVGTNQTVSITALRKLIAAAGRQQTAFFVPGIVTGLVKRLMIQADINLEGDIVTSKRASSGIVAALHALEVLLVVTLSDDTGDAAEASQGGSDVGADGSTLETPADYLTQLRDLSRLEPRRLAVPSDPNSDVEALEAAISQDKHALWVEASPVWARATAIRASELLNMCIPRLCIHQNAAIRSQVVRLASGVLGSCQVAFEGQDAVLVEALLLLAQDDWPSVSVPAGDYLSSRLPTRQREHLGAQLLADDHGDGEDVSRSGRGAFRSSTPSLLNLPNVLKTRSEVFSRQEAARLCSMVEHCRSADMPSVVGYSGTGDDAVLDALVACFEIEESAAVAIASAPLITAPCTLELAPPGADPAMPGALRYMTSKASYDIHARIVRLLASDALRNDTRNPLSTSFSGFVASCVRELRQLCTAAAAADGQGACLRAAAVMTIIAEIFAGATLLIENEASVDAERDCETDSSLICRAAVLEVLCAMQDGGVWRLRTNHHAAPGNPRSRSDGSENTYGVSAILLQRCLVFVGVAARCLKRCLVGDGSCTVTFLLPVIERYAGDCQYVSAAAKDAIHNICAFCGYPGGLRDLVTGNMDYVIDGMCTRLRQPSIYPDAPKLFAALLRENGVAVSLIPLLADPAQHMIRGVSILQRREKPENVLAFVMCTQEIALGLLHVSIEDLRYFEALSADVSNGACDLAQRDGSEPPEEDRDDPEAGATPATIDEISEYFRDRHASKLEDETNDVGDKLNVTRDVWDATYLARNRLEAAARLSQSIADSLGPLSVSKSLPVAVQSFTATIRALEALRNAHRGLDLFKNCIEERLACDGQTPPPSGGKQAPPTFLPSVHLFWTPLMGSLNDWRVPVVETCIEALGSLLLLAPDFLSKRFRTDAWPVLRALLKDGMPMAANTLSGTSAGAGVSRDAGSPALASRVRRAVVGLFSAIIDALNQEESESLVQPIARVLLRDVLEHACESTDQAVADSMRAGFERIATVHPDSAWATLYTYAAERQDKGAIGVVGPASVCGLVPGSGGHLAPIQDFRQWDDEWWWVTNHLQSLMM